MISYGVRAAFDSGVFDEVIVSTDDEEIRDLALTFGAKSPFQRPSEISNDSASFNGCDGSRCELVE